MRHELADRCRGRWSSILAQLGLGLDDKARAHKNTACPMCGGRDRFHFSDKDVGLWHCRGCDEGGDGVRLVMRMKRIGFKEAAELIESVVGKTPQSAPRGNGDDKPKDPLKPWGQASPDVLGSTVDIYLKGRGIHLTAGESRSLRFRPALWHWPSQTKWPAMVGLVALATGKQLTSHLTFLEPDGSGKAPIDRPRLFPAGASPAGGGVWFGEPDPEREFLVAEGIESLLSALRIFGVTAGCAALSATGVSRLILPLEVRRVRVFADNDELGQGLVAAREAWRRWRDEGREVVVSIADRVGEDANDILIRRTGRHG
jgi:putative DNA primase/helicase